MPIEETIEKIDRETKAGGPFSSYIATCLKGYLHAHEEEEEKFLNEGKTVNGCAASIIGEARARYRKNGKDGVGVLTDEEVAAKIRASYGLSYPVDLADPGHGYFSVNKELEATEEKGPTFPAARRYTPEDEGDLFPSENGPSEPKPAGAGKLEKKGIMDISLDDLFKEG